MGKIPGRERAAKAHQGRIVEAKEKETIRKVHDQIRKKGALENGGSRSWSETPGHRIAKGERTLKKVDGRHLGREEEGPHASGVWGQELI